MTYNMEKIYSSKDFESLSHAELLEMYRNVKLMAGIVHGVKKIKKVTTDLALMRQIIKGFNQNYNQKEQL